MSSLNGKKGVVIDTMIFIYLFEDHPAYADKCEKIVEHMREGFFTGVITPVTAAEIIVKPLKQKLSEVADRYLSAVQNLKNATTPDITMEIAKIAGALKAKYGMPLPDMLQVAMALYFPAHTLVTNDHAMKKVKEIDIFLLDDIPL